MTFPPRTNQEFDYGMFADGLHEIIPEKITGIIADMELLQERYDIWKAAIKNCKRDGKLNEFGVYYWSVIAELEFAEYTMQQKWLLYWVNIYEKLPEVVMPKRKYAEFIDRKQEVERAKQQPIEDHYEGQLRMNGTRLFGKCPFHDERTPSFFIFRNNNTFHCFGCGANGDVIEFVRRLKKLDFPEAIRILL